MKLSKNTALLPINREGMGSLNLVLTWDEKHLVLIDAGLPDQIDEVSEAIRAEGFSPENLSHIIITHQDWDHIGCVSGLKKLAPALKVIAHEEEAPYLDGSRVPVKLAKRLEEYDTMTEEQRKGVDPWKNMYEKSPIKVDIKVTDGQELDICGGVKFFHVPGHTPGHIAAYLQESRIIVCGDAVNIAAGEIVDFNPIYINDMEMAAKSLEKIKGLDFDGIVAYHSGYLKIGGAA